MCAPFLPTPIKLGPVWLRFDTPVLMGIVNVTPDSFSDGGRLGSVDAAMAHARLMVEAGALILDVGGESTRPGATGVDSVIEIGRVVPVIEALNRAGLSAAISVDTAKAEVARAALRAGAHMVNDVTALADPAMAPAIADAGAAVVLMHMRGTPRTMQQGEIVYEDVLAEVRSALAAARAKAVAAGVEKERILVDPGIGFGKTLAHNLILTKRLGELASLGQPIVYGPSRKRFLGEITSRDVTDRDRATAAACAAAVLCGAHVLRVHDVGAVRDAVRVAHAIRHAES